MNWIGKSVSPLVAKSASASPYALENLNPPPLQAEMKVTRFSSGKKSRKGPPWVYIQTLKDKAVRLLTQGRWF